MSTIKKKWRLECSEQMKTLFSCDIDVSKITEQRLQELIRLLISKYALSNEEILQTCYNQNTKNFRNYIHIERSQSRLNEKLSIGYYCCSSNIDISIILVDV